MRTNQVEVEAAKEQVNKITHGLDDFMLKPERVEGEALLDHMVQFRKRNNERDRITKLLVHLFTRMSKV